MRISWVLEGNWWILQRHRREPRNTAMVGCWGVGVWTNEGDHEEVELAMNEDPNQD